MTADEAEKLLMRSKNDLRRRHTVGKLRGGIQFTASRSPEKPRAKIISAATDAGWLKVSQLKKKDQISILNLLVDAGEAESIQLALEQNADILIIDDRKGRKIAKIRDVRIIGTGGILIAVKRKGIWIG